MPMHNTSGLLKYGIGTIIVLVVLLIIKNLWHGEEKAEAKVLPKSSNTMLTAASSDSEAESLNTLTAELARTQRQIQQVTVDNAQIRAQNAQLLAQVKTQQETAAATNSSNTISTATSAVKNSLSLSTVTHANNSAQPITVVSDIAQPSSLVKGFKSFDLFASSSSHFANTSESNKMPMANSWTAEGNKQNSGKLKLIPYDTIPANATAVDDKLMSALVGRIPIKGVVTDPYPFKIVFSNDTLAANGLRVPHLQQMVVSGYTEGDLNLLSVRGWVTSLTFVFDDGTISTTTSNDNNIGHFTKQNALGYLSDPWGNPFIRGKLITNAPSYVAGNVALGAAQGAASAYAQSQTTNQTSLLGTTSSTVTGSANKYVAAMATVNAANQVQQWWHDREEQSFDAIYVPAGQTVVVNFAKEIPIDYNPQGRKIAYASVLPRHFISALD